MTGVGSAPESAAASGRAPLRWFFLFFLLSGFCGLVDEVVWLRIAMAQFGVVTPLVSIVLSVFMGGLALGSWQGGRLAKRLAGSGGALPLRLYAAAELCIAASAFVVPAVLRHGRDLMLGGGGADAGWGSLRYHAASGAWIALALLPFCVCMGATFPLAMAALRNDDAGAAKMSRVFGHLYVANVLGATCGTLVSAFILIELFGFRGTLYFAAALNVAIAIGALVLSARRTASGAEGDTVRRARADAGAAPAPAGTFAPAGPGAVSVPRGIGASRLVMLFVTGLASMAMEVVWVRQFTPYLGTVVYAFALILALYLAATFVGSTLYRVRSGPAGSPRTLGLAWVGTGLAALLPLIATDPRLPLPIIDPANPQPGDLTIGALRVALGLGLFCGAVGFITPMLVDRYSSGDPERAGRAYAVNVLGCILGPLVACFVLLPATGERWSIALLALPLFALAPLAAGPDGGARPAARALLPALSGALAIALGIVGVTKDYTGLFPSFEARRDYEATVIATDARGRKELLVNGVGITAITPITKIMVHLPMAFLAAPPKSALVICFGMGTTFRSALSWDVPTTAAELVPSVPELFGFYHPDGPALLRSPLAHIVIDDGRRFLERTTDQFDVITVDPPPPVEAAGSSLLYSREFYALARRRLRPGGILQQWFPGGEPAIEASVARAIFESFPNVRVFPSVAGWGFHFLASEEPIPDTPAAVLTSRLPPRAAADLVEWFEGVTPEQVFDKLLSQEIPRDRARALPPGVPALTDDRPFNEYYLVRRLLSAGG